MIDIRLTFSNGHSLSGLDHLSATSYIPVSFDDANIDASGYPTIQISNPRIYWVGLKVDLYLTNSPKMKPRSLLPARFLLTA